MRYYTIPPPINLAGYVRHFWVLEGEVEAGKPYIHRCMADSCADLIFHYRGHFDKLTSNNATEDCFLSGVQGQSQQYRRFMVAGQVGMLGMRLYPHAIPRLFGIPASEFTNQMPDLACALGRKAASIEEQVMLAATNAMRVDIVSAFLQQQLPAATNKHSGIVHMINRLMAGNTTANIDELARSNFLSLRQFERNFKVLTGYSTKLFSRIIRFQGTLAQSKDNGRSLTDIAYDAGYYDQSHFIHDFREFSGYHPMHYFTGKAEGITAPNA